MKNIFDARHKFGNDFMLYIITSYCRVLLHACDYLSNDLLICLKYLQPVKNMTKNISPETITYPSLNINQTVLIYASGGIGDVLMHSRFMIEYCDKFNNSKIYFLVDERIKWIFEDAFNKISNLTILSHRELFFNVDHHFNVTELFYLLKKSYDDIDNNKYLAQINVRDDMSLYGAISNTKKNIVINWHGNNENYAEIFRKINLKSLKKLFDIKNINWISVQKDVSNEDKNILKKYNVLDLSEVIDKSKCYYDTISILKNVDYVVSIDSSLLHLAGLMNVNTIGLINKGCDWRWTNNDKTNWYPDITILKQDIFNDWDSVINKLYDIVS
jgi:ADP-heptose:LPS heptosyltransferase